MLGRWSRVADTTHRMAKKTKMRDMHRKSLHSCRNNILTWKRKRNADAIVLIH